MAGTRAHSWNPGQYLKFGGHRTRPAIELLARVDVAAPKSVYDLGCGPGNSTALLAERWPDANVAGVDGSADMLAQARGDHPGLDWVAADLAAWEPAAPADVLFSNAVLHWLDDHGALFPGLVGHLAPGGVLAVQMPNNFRSPSHTCMGDAIEAGPWAGRLRGVRRKQPVAEPRDYYGWLRPVASEVDIWETEYLQLLEGDNAVAEWTKGSALRPLLDALDSEAERDAFFEVYSKLVRKAYPKAPDGRTPFPFRRLFIVARR